VLGSDVKTIGKAVKRADELRQTSANPAATWFKSRSTNGCAITEAQKTACIDWWMSNSNTRVCPYISGKRLVRCSPKGTPYTY